MNQSKQLFPDKSRIINFSVAAFLAFSGIFVLINIFQGKSESGSALFLGYSLLRWATIFISSIGIALFGYFAVSIYFQKPVIGRLAQRANTIAASPIQRSVFIFALFVIFAVVVSLLILCVSPAANEVPFLSVLFNRLGGLLIWMEFVILGLGLIIGVNIRKEVLRAVFSPWFLACLFATAVMVYYVSVKFYVTVTFSLFMRGTEQYLFVLPVFFLLWGVLHQFFRESSWYPKVNQILLAVGVFLFAYVVYRQTTQWIDNRFTPNKAYFHLLADSFLNGRLYLPNPPYTHDLTNFEGQWYVPNPPLPGIVLVPLVALVGVENVNMVHFSVFWGAINVLLVFLILAKGSEKGLLPAGLNANLWLTFLFALGTCHWWMSLIGNMAYISQLLTLTFAALSVYFAISGYSPWLIGLSLGLSIAARPNVFTLWPFLLGIYLFLGNQTQSIQWKKVIVWSVKSAIPVCAAVAALLYYNYARFGDFFDFGYVTIHGSPNVVKAVQEYGMFNIHFLFTNLKAMFITSPLKLLDGRLTFAPGWDGYSAIIMTPALLYVFRAAKLNWWKIGAWISIVLSAGLILLYHNNGAAQLGFRYLMDFILPVLCLMAAGMGKHASRLFKGLTIFSIIQVAAGIWWWWSQ